MAVQSPIRPGPPSEAIHSLIETAATAVEVAGVATIVLGAALAAVLFARHLLSATAFSEAYHHFRGNLGRAILLGLELLVAADIIFSVTLELSVERLAALGILVLIRTFLSFSLEVEIDGRWPWRERESQSQPRAEKL